MLLLGNASQRYRDELPSAGWGDAANAVLYKYQIQVLDEWRGGRLELLEQRCHGKHNTAIVRPLFHPLRIMRTGNYIPRRLAERSHSLDNGKNLSLSASPWESTR